MEEAAAGKARLPTVDSSTDGTMRRLVAAERRVRRPGTSEKRVSSTRYRMMPDDNERTNELMNEMMMMMNELANNTG